jgi:heat shock protein HspQ
VVALIYRKSKGARAAPTAFGAGMSESAKPGVARTAKYGIGQVVKHRIFPFRGIIFDVDPVFDNTEEWYQSIPEDMRPRRDQPFYHLYAENAETEYIAYVSEQNLLVDDSKDPVRHPQARQAFIRGADGSYRSRGRIAH